VRAREKARRKRIKKKGRKRGSPARSLKNGESDIPLSNQSRRKRRSTPEKQSSTKPMKKIKRER